VIDCSPAMNLLTYNALLYAEELIVPVGMDLMAIIGARQTLNGVEEVRDLWPDRRLDLLAVLPRSPRPPTTQPSPRWKRAAGSADGPVCFLAGYPAMYRPELRDLAAPDHLGVRAAQAGPPKTTRASWTS